MHNRMFPPKALNTEAITQATELIRTDPWCSHGPKFIGMTNDQIADWLKTEHSYRPLVSPWEAVHRGQEQTTIEVLKLGGM